MKSGPLLPALRLPACVALVLVGAVGCAEVGRFAAARPYPGALQVYLQPADAQGICAVTVSLRNLSGERMGEANLRLDWLGARATILRDQRLRLDPTDVGKLDAKNAEVPGRCADVRAVRVRRAAWRVGWDLRDDLFVPIAGVEGAALGPFSWNEAEGLFMAGSVPQGN
jgi:hypothetical protein